MSEVEIIEPVPEFPVVVHEGKYRLYIKPDGSYRVQYKRTDKDEEDFFELPSAMVEMAKAAAEGNITPAQMIKMAMNFMGGRM